MVATDDSANTVPGHIESPGTFGKLRQTLSSSLLTAQDKGKQTTGKDHKERSITNYI